MANAKQPTIIANIQKHGEFRLYGPHVEEDGVRRLGDCIAIPAGEERPVPPEVWNRYKDRRDIKAMDRIKIVIGGFSAVSPGELETSEGQRAAIAAAEARLRDERESLEAMRAELEAREAALMERVV
jgi:hypothetical protein